MSRLNQIIAVEKGVKTRVQQGFTEVHHALMKPQLLAGISRTYQPKDEEGEKFPSESTRVQVKVNDSLKQVKTLLTELFDVTAAKDFTNCVAKADIVVDDKVLVKDCPATYLLFLEKQLVDIGTFIKKLPVVDPSEVWKMDSMTGLLATDPVETARTKKIPRNHVKSAATDKHPAQVEIFTEDILVGLWKTTKFSGALPAPQVTALTERVEKLSRAVKFAREAANGTEVVKTEPGAAVLGYIFG